MMETLVKERYLFKTVNIEYYMRTVFSLDMFTKHWKYILLSYVVFALWMFNKFN